MLRISVNNCCRSILKLNTVQYNTTCRSIHLVRRTRHTISKDVCHFDSNRSKSHILNAFFVRYASTNETVVNNVKQEPELIRIDWTNHATNNNTKVDELFEIPDIPPMPVEEVVEVVQKIHPNGEIAFSSLGLGGYSPIGLLQSSLEWMHIHLDLPWWGTIVLGTVIVRTCMFPLVIKSQRYAALMSIYYPQITKLQEKLSEARLSGDHYNSALYANELYQYMKDKGLGPWKSMGPMLVQGPLFLCFVLGLRRMADLPVQSLQTGGLWWFTDLTAVDPYYILPIITSVTLAITIEVGTDTAAASSMGSLRYVLRAIPLISLPFATQFSSAVLVYWVMSNFYSLIQTSMLRTKYMRKVFNLPEIVKHKPNDIIARKGFIKGVKESWQNMSITKQIADRDNADAVQFNRAGRGPIIKTYSYDPTKQKLQPKIMTKSK
ncbi:PREDICTED: mitochondrial inner membrane protein OXA1L [Polistes dominula]|uniref:Mitochondrial inner membrane protein OXA1L n=1 Tax=Polistes dominula TaxID=743375 RepID=A0ABM1JFG0_POLDO|nr:PREDICTED: mitochondrial inner membrane protein OXA1L [Polistes dominula]